MALVVDITKHWEASLKGDNKINGGGSYFTFYPMKLYLISSFVEPYTEPPKAIREQL